MARHITHAPRAKAGSRARDSTGVVRIARGSTTARRTDGSRAICRAVAVQLTRTERLNAPLASALLLDFWQDLSGAFASACRTISRIAHEAKNLRHGSRHLSPLVARRGRPGIYRVCCFVSVRCRGQASSFMRGFCTGARRRKNRTGDPPPFKMGAPHYGRPSAFLTAALDRRVRANRHSRTRLSRTQNRRRLK